MKSKLIVCAGVVAFGVASAARAALFVSTDQTGANVQCDVKNTQHWTYSVSQDVSDIVGGLFSMKRGPATFSTISFVIFEGTFADYGTSSNLLSVTLGPSDFTQQFSLVAFSSTPIELDAGKVYTAVLSSNAPDTQSSAYFIKTGSLMFVDDTGTPVGGGPSIIPPVPAPGAALLLAAAGLAARRRRLRR